MSKNSWGSEAHRFEIEELLDLYHPAVTPTNSQASIPGKARNSVPKPNKEKRTATKPRKRRIPTGA